MSVSQQIGQRLYVRRSFICEKANQSDSFDTGGLAEKKNLDGKNKMASSELRRQQDDK